MHKLEGKWDFTIITMMGEEKSINNFKIADDGTITGEVYDPKTQKTAIIEEGGKADGNKFKFNVTLELPFGKMPFTIEGELLENDTLKGQSTMPMGVSGFTAIRI
jgi:hypothetical protein